MSGRIVRRVGMLVAWVLLLGGVALAATPGLQRVYAWGWQIVLGAALGSDGSPSAPPSVPAAASVPAPFRVGGAEGATGAVPQGEPGRAGLERLLEHPTVRSAAGHLLGLLGRWLQAVESLMGPLVSLLHRLGIPEGWLAAAGDDPALALPGAVGTVGGEATGPPGPVASPPPMGAGSDAGAPGAPAAGEAPALARLRIPRAGVDAVVLRGTTPSVLARGPGFYPEAEPPGPGSRVAIAAHRTTYGAWFRHLDRLVPGDAIDLWFDGRWYRYRVERVFTARPDDWSVVLQGPRPGLVLTTCHPPGSSRERLVVHAELAAVAGAPR